MSYHDGYEGVVIVLVLNHRVDYFGPVSIAHERDGSGTIVSEVDSPRRALEERKEADAITTSAWVLYGGRGVTGEEEGRGFFRVVMTRLRMMRGCFGKLPSRREREESGYWSGQHDDCSCFE